MIFKICQKPTKLFDIYIKSGVDFKKKYSKIYIE
jgi:hypothetical protein